MIRKFVTRSTVCEKCKSTNVQIDNGEYTCFKCGNKGLIELKPANARQDIRLVALGKAKEDQDGDDEPASPFKCAVCKSTKPNPIWTLVNDAEFCSAKCSARRRQ